MIGRAKYAEAPPPSVEFCRWCGRGMWMYTPVGGQATSVAMCPHCDTPCSVQNCADCATASGRTDSRQLKGG